MRMTMEKQLINCHDSGSEHPPPPPPPFSGRQMLPPSPQISQVPPSTQATPSRQPSTTLPFSNGRDLPALSASTMHRPSSSMSISSMLGSDNVKPSRDPGPQNNTNGPSSVVGNFLTSPTRQSNHATSPPSAAQSSSRFPDSFSSPDKYKLYQSPANRPYRSYSGGSEQRAQPLVQSGSPDAAGSSVLQRSSNSQYSPTSVSGLQRDSKPNHPGEVSKNGRPSSQPSASGTPSFEFDKKVQLGKGERPKQTARKHYIDLEESNREDATRPRIEKSVGIRDYPQQRAEPSQVIRGTYLGDHRSPRKGQEQERLNGSSQHSNSRSDVSPEISNPRHRSGAGRSSERPQYPTNAAQSPFSSDTLRRLREERQVLHQQSTNSSPVNHQPRMITHVEERQPSKYPGPPVTFASSTEPPSLLDVSEQHQNKEDTTTHSRSALALLIENSKRGGRFSPLPQAVQGAQGRTSGPASDPGIKNEFGRMFSGIGSGVGSAGPTGSGTNTPFPPPSPTMSHGPQRRTPFSNSADLNSSSKPRTGIKNSRKTRKVRDDESRPDLEDGEGGTPTSAAARGMKKSRGTHHHHPHHVHQ